MKVPLIAFLLAAAAVLAPAADDASLSGKWQIQRSAGGNESQQDCAITQKKSDLTGTCSSTDRGTVQISGKVDGKNVTWTYEGDSPGGTVTVVYTGPSNRQTRLPAKWSLSNSRLKASSRPPGRSSATPCVAYCTYMVTALWAGVPPILTCSGTLPLAEPVGTVALT